MMANPIHSNSDNLRQANRLGREDRTTGCTSYVRQKKKRFLLHKSRALGALLQAGTLDFQGEPGVRCHMRAERARLGQDQGRPGNEREKHCHLWCANHIGK